VRGGGVFKTRRNCPYIFSTVFPCTVQYNYNINNSIKIYLANCVEPNVSVRVGRQRLQIYVSIHLKSFTNLMTTFPWPMVKNEIVCRLIEM
jgi:hypothetical protein